MKKFTKVSLILAAVFGGTGLVLLIVAMVLGVTWSDVRTAVAGWNFPWGISGVQETVEQTVERVEDYFDDTADVNESVGVGGENVRYYDPCDRLDIELGAGELTIVYGDATGQIEVVANNMVGYSSKVKNGTLKIESGIGSGINNGSIEITLPRDMEVRELDLEVGAGTAVVDGIQLKKADIEVGAGEVNMTLIGTKTDYSYDIECGIGQILIGDSVYSGVANEQKIHNPGAQGTMDIECGAGSVTVAFE